MKAITGWLTATVFLSVSAPMTANAALVSVDGGQMVDDTTLNVTWANTVGSNLTWVATGGAGTAQAWIASLNAKNYGGYSDWTLATGNGWDTTNGNGTGESTSGSDNQLGYLFFNELGNTYSNATTLGTAGQAFNAPNTGPVPSGDITFSLALSRASIFWSNTPFPDSSTSAWAYGAYSGPSCSRFPAHRERGFQRDVNTIPR